MLPTPTFTLFLSPGRDNYIFILGPPALHNYSCSYFKIFTRKLAAFRGIDEESNSNKLVIGAIQIRKMDVK